MLQKLAYHLGVARNRTKVTYLSVASVFTPWTLWLHDSF